MGRPAVLKISEILLKYPTFEGVFYVLRVENKNKIIVSVNCSIHTKKLINIKVRKLYMFSLKSKFFGTKLAKITQLIVGCSSRDSSPRDLHIGTLEASQNQFTFLFSII